MASCHRKIWPTSGWSASCWTRWSASRDRRHSQWSTSGALWRLGCGSASLRSVQTLALLALQGSGCQGGVQAGLRGCWRRPPSCGVAGGDRRPLHPGCHRGAHRAGQQRSRACPDTVRLALTLHVDSGCTGAPALGQPCCRGDSSEAACSQRAVPPSLRAADLPGACREAGGIANLVGVLRETADLPEDVLTALLHALLALAADEESQLLVAQAGGLPCIIRLLGAPPSQARPAHLPGEPMASPACCNCGDHSVGCRPGPRTPCCLCRGCQLCGCPGGRGAADCVQECLLLATQLIGRLAHAQQNKDALREAGAIVALLKLLRPKNVAGPVAEAVCQALTILAVNNEVNQDYCRCWPRLPAGVQPPNPRSPACCLQLPGAPVCLPGRQGVLRHVVARRSQYGISPLISLLSSADPHSNVTLAAADAVRAMAMNKCVACAAGRAAAGDVQAAHSRVCAARRTRPPCARTGASPSWSSC